MSIYVIKQGETMVDAVLNATGSLDNWQVILEANGLDSWTPDVKAGDEIIIPDTVVMQPNAKSVLDTYPANNNSIAPDFMVQVLALINFIKPVVADLVDKDGNIYHVITVGDQMWTIENLRTTKFGNGDSIPVVTDASAWASQAWGSEGACCFFNDDPLNKPIYGLLYNWYAINNVKNIAYLEKNGVQDTGWKVPSKADWIKLINAVGGLAVAGGKLKEGGLSHWNAPNTGAIDAVGFLLYGAGFRSYTGAFLSLLQESYLWASDGDVLGDGSFNHYIKISNNSEAVILNGGPEVSTNKIGYSVRLLKDLTTDDDMKYIQTINLVGGDITTITTTLTELQVPYSYLIEDSSGNPIGGSADIQNKSLVGGVWVLQIYSTDAISNAKLKIIY